MRYIPHTQPPAPPVAYVLCPLLEGGALCGAGVFVIPWSSRHAGHHAQALLAAQFHLAPGTPDFDS